MTTRLILGITAQYVGIGVVATVVLKTLLIVATWYSMKPSKVARSVPARIFLKDGQGKVQARLRNVVPMSSTGTMSSSIVTIPVNTCPLVMNVSPRGVFGITPPARLAC
jgi:hypothetical protein